MRKYVLISLVGLMFFSLGCGNYYSLKKGFKRKSIYNTLLVRVESVSSKKIEITAFQAWRLKVKVAEIGDSTITQTLPPDEKISFSIDDFLMNDEECKRCKQLLSTKQIEIDKIPVALFDKGTKRILKNLQPKDLVLMSIGEKVDTFFLASLFNFNKCNYNLLEKTYVPCIRADFSELEN